MDSKVNYTLVGFFVLILGSAFIAAAVWLSGNTSKKTYASYVAYMSESVSGLNPKAAVKYRGVEVGQVHEIALDQENPERVRLLLDIEEGTPIKEDTVAILSIQGITGLAFIELTGGRRDSPLLQARPDEAYAEIKTGPSLLVRLDVAVSGLLMQLQQVATQTGDIASRLSVLLNDDNQRAITKTLGHVERLTGTLAAHLDGLEGTLDNVKTISENTAHVSNELPALFARVDRSMAAMEDLFATLSHAASGVDQIVRGTEQDLSRFSRENLQQLGRLFSELQQLAERLQRVVQDLEREPNMLLFGRRVTRPGPGE